jgi:nucleotide-binding universal stress UspA family protein
MQTYSEMPSFDKVLVATDFSAASRAAFQTALDVCKTLGASLYILHVFEYANAVPPEAGGQLLELEGVYQGARRGLDRLVEQAKGEGVTCEAFMGSGIPALAILDAIPEKEIGLVVLGTNALHGFERFVFGSVAEDVLRKAPCPVLTVGPQVHDPGKTTQIDGPVVFATDFDLKTIHAIRYAATLCTAMMSPLHCLHVLPRTLEGGVRSHVIPQIMAEALQHVAVESGTAICPPVCATTYGSEVSNAVVNYATQQRAKLIVLGVRQASMAKSHGPAHIAYRIITEAPCPVLTMAFASHARESLVAAAACYVA